MLPTGFRPPPGFNTVPFDRNDISLSSDDISVEFIFVLKEEISAINYRTTDLRAYLGWLKECNVSSPDEARLFIRAHMLTPLQLDDDSVDLQLRLLSTIMKAGVPHKEQSNLLKYLEANNAQNPDEARRMIDYSVLKWHVR